MASSDEPSALKINRQTTTPFHLKLFYHQNSFHHLSVYPIPSPPLASGSAPSAPAPALPPHLQIYTWYSCSLRELAHLLTSCLPSLLPSPAVGTRLSFRLIYPDTKSQVVGASGPGSPGAGEEGRGRYLSKDMGSVIVGPKESVEGKETGASSAAIGRNTGLQGEEADRTLQDVRFVIGDYVECAILPPLPDGSVAPPISSRATAGGAAFGGGMRAFPPVRENGFGRPRPGGGGIGRGGGELASGEWRRGERVPDNGRRIYSRGGFRNRGRPY
ncbi:hypothetical protein PRK78_000006 [Emydomyces testavorans]|uniref:Sin3-associated polypeptide Sap18 n=1 Tax=Emydomyces testavorans TaxID=2070801 RepID=A0AAF0D9U9_9EURO|nr:hypothetical protein PRK78_000006 [Emydomyces testavorans]